MKYPHCPMVWNRHPGSQEIASESNGRDGRGLTDRILGSSTSVDDAMPDEMNMGLFHFEGNPGKQRNRGIMYRRDFFQDREKLLSTSLG